VYPHDGVPGPPIGFLQEAVRWWDYWLKDADNGIMSEPKLQLLAQLADETGASYIACSIETSEGCHLAVEATRSQLGPIEVLVNNAAPGTGQNGSVLDLE
jgi:NAD(P)-dependent dehydrogenase (short-subunit alcohol dehydrogenase family)